MQCDMCKIQPTTSQAEHHPAVKRQSDSWYEVRAVATLWVVITTGAAHRVHVQSTKSSMQKKLLLLLV